MLDKMLRPQPVDFATLYIDMDSFFASAEQQRWPHLQGKPVGVCPNLSPGACVVACSREAKRLGVRTGMRTAEAQRFAPQIVFVRDSAAYYRALHGTIVKILEATPCRVEVRGIDEMYLGVPSYLRTYEATRALAQQIKRELLVHLGDIVTASIGIAANGWQAKMIASSCKPDGIRTLLQSDRAEFYKSLRLTDCTGIARRFSRQLHRAGIYSTALLYAATEPYLRQRFGVVGTKWYLRLRGFEVDDHPSQEKKSIGHQTTLTPRPSEKLSDLWAVMVKMMLKVGYRLRHTNKQARGMFIQVSFIDSTGWSNMVRHAFPFSSQAELVRHGDELIRPLESCFRPVKRLTITTFDLVTRGQQGWLDEEAERSERLSQALDTIRERFGARAITPASGLSDAIFPDRVGFGSPDAALLPSRPPSATRLRI